MIVDRVDPGWLFLLAGAGMLGAATLIPAMEQLDEARWHRGRALAVEAHRLERLDRHEAYLARLDSRDPDLVRSLAASQLNSTTTDRRAFLLEPIRADADASVFPQLEPGALDLPEREVDRSLLARMSMNAGARPWLLAGAGLAVFVGLLPRTAPAGAPRYPQPCQGDSPSPGALDSPTTASTSGSTGTGSVALPACSSSRPCPTHSTSTGSG